MRTRRHSVSAVLAIAFLLALIGPLWSQDLDWANMYVTGMSLTRPKDAPVFVNSVSPQSPADRAGIKPGDRLLAIDGVEVAGLREAGERMRSNQPGKVTLRLWRKGEELELTVERERNSAIFERQGLQIKSNGNIYGLDVTETEISAQVELQKQLDPRRLVGKAFPQHLPLDTELFCAGFEVLILGDPPQLFVGGLENGPAKRAGLRNGDLILSIDGSDPRRNAAPEIEGMLSGTSPRTVTLRIQRPGAVAPDKTIQFDLQRTEDVLKQNRLRIVQGRVLHDWISDDEVHWFLGPPQ